MQAVVLTRTVTTSRFQGRTATEKTFSGSVNLETYPGFGGGQRVSASFLTANIIL